MHRLYHPSVSPAGAVEGTLARWYQHYVRANGHEPPPEVTRRARARIERIAARRDARLSRPSE